jgi:hypothetical protein
MKRIVRLSERDLTRIVRRVISEQPETKPNSKKVDIKYCGRNQEDMLKKMEKEFSEVVGIALGHEAVDLRVISQPDPDKSIKYGSIRFQEKYSDLKPHATVTINCLTENTAENKVIMNKTNQETKPYSDSRRLRTFNSFCARLNACATNKM